VNVEEVEGVQVGVEWQFTQLRGVKRRSDHLNITADNTIVCGNVSSYLFTQV